MSIFDDLPKVRDDIETHRRKLEQQHGLTPGLLSAVAKQESGDNNQAVSRAGAVGSMQFLPSTAKEYGIDPLDDYQAAEGAARYLSKYKAEFGDEGLALAAYNAGPGNVRKAGGQIPAIAETQKYVPGVYAKLAKLAAKLNPISEAQADETLPARPTDDPFADVPMAKPAAAKPVPVKSVASEDDPFADVPMAKPAAAKPVAVKPVASEDDPFADVPMEKPAAEALPAKPSADKPADTAIPPELLKGIDYKPSVKLIPPAPRANPRLPLTVLDDVRKGRTDITEMEMADLERAIAAGRVKQEDAEAMAKILAGRNQDAQDAQATGEMARAMRERESLPAVPNPTSAKRVFAEAVLRELTGNTVDTLPPESFPQARKAAEMVREESKMEHPLADIGGSLVGGAVNFVPFLGAAKKILPDLPASLAKQIGEGAVAGAAQGLARQPENGGGLAERADAAALNAGLGMAADVGLHALAKAVRGALQKPAGAVSPPAAGYDKPVTQVEQTPHGPIIRPLEINVSGKPAGDSPPIAPDAVKPAGDSPPVAPEAVKPVGDAPPIAPDAVKPAAADVAADGGKWNDWDGSDYAKLKQLREDLGILPENDKPGQAGFVMAFGKEDKAKAEQFAKDNGYVLAWLENSEVDGLWSYAGHIKKPPVSPKNGIENAFSTDLSMDNGVKYENVPVILQRFALPHIRQTSQEAAPVVPGGGTLADGQAAGGGGSAGVAPEGQPAVAGAGARGAQAAPDDWRALLARADEAESLARATNDKDLQNSLLTQALALRKQADAIRQGQAPKLSAKERIEAMRVVDPQKDDLLTAIRKLGGLDTETESDWKDRFKGMSRKVPGLPAIEQKRYRGNTLDDLTEKLRQYGYLNTRDKAELEELLFLAEKGKPVWSHWKNDFSHLVDEEIPVSTSTDEDWLFVRPGDYNPADYDFVIATDKGDVVPSRPLSLDDLEQLHAEIERADDWFRREQEAFNPAETAGPAEEPAGLPEAGGGGEKIRLDGEAQGRAVDQPVGGDLFGEATAGDRAVSARLELERLAAEKAKARNATGQGAGGGLFDLDNRQAGMDFNTNGGITHGEEGQGQGRRRQTLLDDNQDNPAASGGGDLEANHETGQFERNVATPDESTPVAGGTAQQQTATAAGEAGQAGGEAGQTGSGTLYANPLGPVFKAIGNDVLSHPARNVFGAAVGGYAGGKESQQETGSPLWWLDVGKGAAMGMGVAKLGTMGANVVGAGLRKSGVFGKGGFLDEAAVKAGKIVEGLPYIGRGPVELRELKRRMRAETALMDRQTGEIGAFLHKHFTPSERAMMADLIENRGIVPDLNLMHRQAQALDEYIAAAAERLKVAGMLPEDLETGGYLHRYYAKDLDMVALLRAPFSKRISGTYSLARGTDEPFGRESFSPLASNHLEELSALKTNMDEVQKELDKWQKRYRNAVEGKQGDVFDMDDFIFETDALKENLDVLKQEYKALSNIKLKEFVGDQNGKPTTFFFMPDELPRVESITPPNLAQVDEPGLIDPQTKPIGELQATGREWSVKSAAGDKAVLHRDWTPEERAKWGEIQDAGYRYVRGMQEVSRDLALSRLYSRVAGKADWATADAAEGQALGYVPVPDSRIGKGGLKKYGALAGMYVRPDVWNAIRNSGRNPLAESRIGQTYLSALNKWKLVHTADNPVTHFNNIYSNLEMAFLGGYSAKDLAQGAAILAKGEKSAAYREARDAGLFGHDWASSVSLHGGENMSLNELAETLRNQPEIPDATLVTSKIMDWKSSLIESYNAIKGAQGAGGKAWETLRAASKPVAAAGRGVGKVYGAYANPMRKLYRAEDDLFKISVYQAERNKGMTPEQAAANAENFFFDYNDIPDAVKFVRDFPIGSPFASYFYLAAQAMARNAIERPERMLALLGAYEAANYVFSTAGTSMGPSEYWQLQESLDELAPPWEKGRSLAGMRNTLKMPGMESYHISLARAHALGNPFAGDAGGREKLPMLPGLGELWGSSFLGGNPLHSLVDIAINEDWKGKPIYNPKDPDSEKYRKAAAYLFQSWGPSTPAVPGSYSNTRIMEGVANQAAEDRQAGKQNTLPMALTDTANTILEALGGGQLSGLDRLDNPVSTRDAALASVGIKLRPARPGDWAEMAHWKLGKEAAAIKKRAREVVRNASEGRATATQKRQALDVMADQVQELKGKQASQKRAFDFLKKLYGEGK